MNWHHYSKTVKSTEIADYQTTERLISTLLYDDIPASGIISARDQENTLAGRIEKNTYTKGGLIFLVVPAGKNPEVKDEIFTAISPIKDAVVNYISNFTQHDPSDYYLESCWVVCQREGDYAPLHNHGDVDFAGIWYLTRPACITEKTFPNGHLYIIDEQVFHVPPNPGSLVIWPADRRHGVYPYRGVGNRVAVSFNIKKKQA